MQYILLQVIVVATLCALARADVFSLSDLSWTLRNANGSVVIPAKVPSQAHLDLMRAGIITEPLLGINGMWRTQLCAEENFINLVFMNRLHATMGSRR